MTEEVKTKRGPGRPRKTPAKSCTPARGVLSKPDCEDNIVEVVYSRPEDFKKFATYNHSLSADRVMFGFSREGMFLFTKDYKETTYIRGRAEGAKMEGYYCGKSAAPVIAFDNFFDVFKGVTSTHTCIKLSLRKDSPDKLFGVLQSEDGENRFEWDTIVDQKFVSTFLGKFDDIPKKVVFKLSGSTFKQLVGDVERFEAPWSMKIMAASDASDTDKLYFDFKNKSGQTKCNFVPRKISDTIVSKELKPGQFFSVSVLAESLKPTSNAVLSNVINFVANDSDFMYIWADIGDGCFHIDILVKVLSNRPH